MQLNKPFRDKFETHSITNIQFIENILVRSISMRLNGIGFLFRAENSSLYRTDFVQLIFNHFLSNVLNNDHLRHKYCDFFLFDCFVWICVVVESLVTEYHNASLLSEWLTSRRSRRREEKKKAIYINTRGEQWDENFLENCSVVKANTCYTFKKFKDSEDDARGNNER